MKVRDAKATAIELLVACFNSEQAGGFVGCGMGDHWVCTSETPPDIHEVTGSSFIMSIGDQLVTFRASATRKDG